MRGKVFFASSILDNLRITPAYAGKSTGRQRPPAIAWDHPRVCGEKPKKRVERGKPLGSPPRMRGKEACSTCVHLWYGITPAYAGKSQLEPKAHARRQDHPRVCGEKFLSFFVFCPYVGSPPRMRGKALISIKDVKQARITPAYAGKSPGKPRRVGRPQDHPRVCGEK